MKGNERRKNTQKKLDNKADEILKFLNLKYNNKFIKIEKFPGKLRFTQKSKGKTLNQQELIYEVSKNRLPEIKLTEYSKKADYIVYDKFNNIYYVETKSDEDNLLCEMYNLTKGADRVEIFKKVCKINNEEPYVVFDNFKQNFLKYKDIYINQVYDKLPDFFVFHNKSNIVKSKTKNEFLSEYKLDLIFRHDAGGYETNLTFERPSIIYIEK